MLNVDQEIVQIKRGMRISIGEGALAHAFANLTGSIFLPSFALLLGADAFLIGLLAAIPLFATIAQIPGSLLVERFTHRKHIAVYFSLAARLFWLPMVVLGFMHRDTGASGYLLMLLIMVVIIFNILGAISGVSWLSWMTSLVPDEIRGRFFGLRNSILGMVTITITVTGGYFLDWFPRLVAGRPLVDAFYILFTLAIIAGILSALLLNRQPELAKPEPYRGRYHHFFREPLRNANFRRLLVFAAFWSFAVNFAAPFYVVYMLKDLHLSYTLIGILTVASAVADLTGMGIWGHYSDQYGNRPIMIITAGAAAVIPFFWIFTNGSFLSVYLLIPVLHLAGGFVVSGYNLTSVNLILRSVPEERNSVYFAFWAACNGILAGIGAIAGGIAATSIRLPLPLIHLDVPSIFLVIFVLSSVMRTFSLIFLIRVQEEKGAPVRRVIRVLRSVRSWSSMMGYHPVLQFFLPARSQTGSSPYWPIWRR